jgi:uncharacterized repeat protein (TIGR03803 family)
MRASLTSRVCSTAPPNLGAQETTEPSSKSQRPVRKTVLYSFKGSGDGENPNGVLLNVKGKLYGTTEDGGVSNQGTVFSLSP